MTDFPISDSSRRMGRPPLNVKPTLVRLSEETKNAIRELVGEQGMARFIREAVDREIAHRKKPKGERKQD